MTSTPNLHTARQDLLDACRVVRTDGLTDREDYLCLAEIYLKPWLDQMATTVTEMARTVARHHGGDERSTVPAVAGLGFHADSQLDGAIGSADPSRIARAAEFAMATRHAGRLLAGRPG